MYLYLAQRGRGQAGRSRREMMPRCDVGVGMMDPCERQRLRRGDRMGPEGSVVEISAVLMARGFGAAEAIRPPKRLRLQTSIGFWRQRMAWRVEHSDCRVPASGTWPAGFGQARRGSKVGVRLGGSTEAWQLRKAVRRHVLSRSFPGVCWEQAVSGTHRTGLHTLRERVG
jgi:hypothetical protein